jgi:hypothetical protein
LRKNRSGNDAIIFGPLHRPIFDNVRLCLTPLFDDDRDSTMTAASDGRLQSLPVAGKRAAGNGFRSFVRAFQPLGSKSR